MVDHMSTDLFLSATRHAQTAGCFSHVMTVFPKPTYYPLAKEHANGIYIRNRHLPSPQHQRQFDSVPSNHPLNSGSSNNQSPVLGQRSLSLCVGSMCNRKRRRFGVTGVYAALQSLFVRPKIGTGFRYLTRPSCICKRPNSWLRGARRKSGVYLLL